ncbi:Signal transduction histidine kinase [Pseudonocardia ammonioxydans]|uniref:histidine kinase n=1 Tax=Pseudonocardia ammonioxydans TaxID=260086 RepID=A0A1I5AE60_PSUAM|nr:sensor histidine kinase [Pseudonocardia ammonioxydans]SFN60708.1 Signal transduction histidine kinase [Pseudonocardia ammonioxydans]
MTALTPARPVPDSDSAAVPPGPGPLSAGVRLRRGMGYLLTGLPIGVVALVVAVAGFAAGVGTLVVWLGLPILVLTLRACRGLAGVERRSTEWATGRPLPPHHYRTPSGSGLFRALAEPQSWRDLLHAVVAFPVRIAAFAVAVSWTVGGAGAALYVTWEWALPRDAGPDGLVGLVTGVDSRPAEIALHTTVGVVMLLTAPLVVHGLVLARAGLARGLLTNQTAALRARAAQLESSRRSAVHAEAQTLRRLERDIHDGPQQRLVRIGMDLETVSRRLDDDPDRARPIVTEALEQCREALDELRALSRGIAPPILADRGLGPALAATAARCPVEVSLDVALPDGRRLAAAVENTAYFVVAEALTNVAKHAGASLCTVAVSADAAQVFVQVRDDGRGGAHLGKGHGLAGLADRLATVEGTLDVTSPTGGPTVLTAGIPLGGVGS